MTKNDSATYYDANASDFISSTLSADVNGLLERFEGLLAPRAKILDLGSGSGRDSKYFREAGYSVVAIDPSPAMCEQTRSYAGVPVYEMSAEELSFTDEFDGVWACASLLHVARENQVKVLRLIARALRSGGVLYASWKYGDTDREKGGRFFTDLDETALDAHVAAVPEFELIDTWISADVRDDRESERWLNVLLRKRKELRAQKATDN